MKKIVPLTRMAVALVAGARAKQRETKERVPVRKKDLFEEGEDAIKQKRKEGEHRSRRVIPNVGGSSWGDGSLRKKTTWR